MKDLIPGIETWVADQEKIALATVVQTWGSSPRGVGAKMALTADGKIAGSVSGGCVESAVFEAGVEVLRSGIPQLLHFGVADETAWKVGLACGGQIDVFVEPLDENLLDLQRVELGSGRSYAVATVIRGPAQFLGKGMLVAHNRQVGGRYPLEADETVLSTVRQILSENRSQTFLYQTPGQEELEIFVEVIEPRPQLIIVGGVHIAIALTDIARTLGFRSVVIDPRRAFGSTERFARADQLIQAWPDEAFTQIQVNPRTAIAVLTHDPKIDDPALIAALNSPAFYIGALGSQTTQGKRRNRLLQSGVAEAQLARLHGPIGLKLGGNTPEEIALAIMAEIVAVQHKVPDSLVHYA